MSTISRQPTGNGFYTRGNLNWFGSRLCWRHMRSSNAVGGACSTTRVQLKRDSHYEVHTRMRWSINAWRPTCEEGPPTTASVRIVRGLARRGHFLPSDVRPDDVAIPGPKAGEQTRDRPEHVDGA